MCAAALAIAACGRDDADTLDEGQADMGTSELNAQADNAAADAAAEMEALGNQQQPRRRECGAAVTAETGNEADITPTRSAVLEVEDDVPGM